MLRKADRLCTAASPGRRPLLILRRTDGEIRASLSSTLTRGRARETFQRYGLMFLIAMCCNGWPLILSSLRERRDGYGKRKMSGSPRSLPRSSSTPASPGGSSWPSPARPAPASRRSPSELATCCPQAARRSCRWTASTIDDAVLTAKGLRQRKGAPETFDSTATRRC